jgi:hypothetical protein
MMSSLAQIVVWLNAVANAVGKWLLAPVAVLPGWLSATAIAAVTGVLLLAVYKHTSNQRAIKRVRDDIKAHLLALKLFKDSALVAVRAQGRVFAGAFWLLAFSLVPMAVMLVPVMLILGQLALWYQARPLRVGEEAVLTLKLQDGADASWPAVSLQPTDAVEVAVGPVRVQSKREICWSLKARENGHHYLAFHVGDQVIDKELAVGDGFMRVSAKRPGWVWSDVLLHPWEKPFAPGSPVQGIEIDYPERSSWTSGTNYWVIYWFVVSMVAALCFRRVLNVNL